MAPREPAPARPRRRSRPGPPPDPSPLRRRRRPRHRRRPRRRPRRRAWPPPAPLRLPGLAPRGPVSRLRLPCAARCRRWPTSRRTRAGVPQCRRRDLLGRTDGIGHFTHGPLWRGRLAQLRPRSTAAARGPAGPALRRALRRRRAKRPLGHHDDDGGGGERDEPAPVPVPRPGGRGQRRSAGDLGLRPGEVAENLLAVTHDDDVRLDPLGFGRRQGMVEPRRQQVRVRAGDARGVGPLPRGRAR